MQQIGTMFAMSESVPEKNAAYIRKADDMNTPGATPSRATKKFPELYSAIAVESNLLEYQTDKIADEKPTCLKVQYF